MTELNYSATVNTSSAKVTRKMDVINNKYENGRRELVLHVRHAGVII